MDNEIFAVREIRPQPGPQTKFLRSAADIRIYGGGAGGGKTFGVLLDILRYTHNPLFGAVVFRRTTVQLKSEGGIWDESEQLYPLLGARGLRQQLEWRFPSGAKIKMSHLEHDKNRLDWQSAQIPYIAFEEICQFTSNQFWYLVSRNRSMSGVPGQIVGTCNPDPDSFVAKLIAWWIDQKTGYAIPNRSGVIRWFIRGKDDALVWGFSPEELKEQFGEDCQPQSLTFIKSTIFDNKIFMAKDPTYLAKLKALPKVERLQLLGEGDQGGNWLVRPAAGMYFQTGYFEVVDAAPAEVAIRCRYWDRAASILLPGQDPDATAGVKVSRDHKGIFYIEHVSRMFASAHQVERAMKNTAKQDGTNCIVGYMQDPGSAGKGEAEATARALAGFIVKFAVATGDKETRAKPVSSQAEAGNIKIVKGDWNELFLRELENFPTGRFDDQVDGLSGAFDILVAGRPILVV